MRKNEKIFTIILAISSFLLANVLMKPRSITIIIGDNESVTLQTPVIYTLEEVLIILVSSILIGISSASILLSRSEIQESKLNMFGVKSLVRLLEGPERKILEFITRKGGEALQSEIWAETGLSKATVSRVLKEMEQKGLISRKKYGATKIVRISDRFVRSRSHIRKRDEHAL